MKCKGCGSDTELRLGYCFDCASRGERRAACRTVVQHLLKCVRNLVRCRLRYARFDLRWAFQRLTRTGDYAKDGYFDWIGIPWRDGRA